MANLDPTKQIPTDPTTGQPTTDPSTSTTAPQVSSAGAGDVTSGVSTAGVGAGGTGGWTNIQAYLTANKDNNNSSQNLSNTVGGQFGQDQSKITNDASAAQNQADQTAASNKFSNDDINSWISGYNDPNKSDTDKAGIKQTAQDALTKQWSTPQSFASQGLSGQTQNYGEGLKSDQGFQGIMQGLYNNAAGGQISSGQLALQNELDSNNGTVNQTRQDLLGQYQKLGGLPDQTNTATNAAIKADQDAYAANQLANKNYLTGQAQNYYGQYQQAIAPPPSAGGVPGGVGERKPTSSGQQFADIPTAANNYNTINGFLSSGAAPLDPNAKAGVAVVPQPITRTVTTTRTNGTGNAIGDDINGAKDRVTRGG